MKVLSGTADNNLMFSEIIKLMQELGFEQRIKGSHHILYKVGIEEILNLQPKESKAKAYQVRQVREIIIKYKLGEMMDV